MKLLEIEKKRDEAYINYQKTKDVKYLNKGYEWNGKALDYLFDHRFDHLSEKEVLNIKNNNNVKRN